MPAVDPAGFQLSAQIGLHRSIRVSLDAGHHANAHQVQCSLHSLAQTAAEHHVNLVLLQEVCQRLMAGSVGGNHLGFRHRAVLYFVNLKILCFSKMLENRAIFISNCKIHWKFSFIFLPSYHEKESPSI